MGKTEFEIEVVKRTNDLIQVRMNRNISEMKGWCVPYVTNLHQAIIDSIYRVRCNIEIGKEKEIWEAVMIALSEIKEYNFKQEQ